MIAEFEFAEKYSRQCRTRVYFQWISPPSKYMLISSLDHPDLNSLNELLTNNFDAKARLTEISVKDLIGLNNISMTTTLTAEMFLSMSFIHLLSFY